MTIEIVDFPIKKGGSFHSFLQHSVTVYQRIPVFPGESRNGKLGANSLIPMVPIRTVKPRLSRLSSCSFSWLDVTQKTVAESLYVHTSDIYDIHTVYVYEELA